MHTIKQTKIISDDLIDCIKSGAECYLDITKVTDDDIVEALQKMDDKKYSVTKSLNRLLNFGYDSSDCCNVIQIALYDDIIYEM